ARFVLSVHSRSGLDRLLNAAPDRGFGRAYVEGHIDVEPLEAFFEVVHSIPRRRLIAGLPALLRVAISLGARPALQSLAAEARLHGRRHSRQRDSAAVRCHYDLAPEFYALWLDRTLTYSCAYMLRPHGELDNDPAAELALP